jgi:hypothetical protein
MSDAEATCGLAADDTADRPAIEAASQRKPPSPVWIGGLMMVILYGGSAWLLAYTLLSVPFIEPLGAWNYVIVLGCIVALSALAYSWRGDRPDAE